MSFDENERRLLGELANVLIPASEGFPSASEAGVAGEGLDQVLSFRPDLGPGLKKLLATASGQPAADFIAELQTRAQTDFSLLGEVVAGAYFLNPQVRAKLDYH